MNNQACGNEVGGAASSNSSVVRPHYSLFHKVGCGSAIQVNLIALTLHNLSFI